MKEILLHILRWVTLPISFLYGGVVWLRNKLYDWGLSESLRFNLPIINVGNLSVGGTGKTPHTEYLIEILKDTYNVATLSRGYKRYTRGFVLAQNGCSARDIGDEPMQFFMKYDNISVCVCEDRIIAVPQLLQRKPGIQVLLLDDAFQHRSIAPSLNILLTDVTVPYNKDFILPFGTLREFRSGAARADIIIVTKCDPDFTEQQAQKFKQALNPLPHQQVFFSTLKYQQVYAPATRNYTSLSNKNVLLVTAIANNARIVAYVKQQATMVHTLRYRDHHYFSDADCLDIIETYGNMPQDNRVLLCTEKDYTRLVLHQQLFTDAKIDIYVLPVRIQILFNQEVQFRKIVLQHILTYYPIIDLDTDGQTQQQ